MWPHSGCFKCSVQCEAFGELNVLSQSHGLDMSPSQLNGFKLHCSIEGFFCIVRNTPDFHMTPQWHFTCKELANYMKLAVCKKWDTAEVRAKIEAFVIVGCDVLSQCGIYNIHGSVFNYL